MSLRRLLLTERATAIKDIMFTDIISVKATEENEDVANMMQKYDLVVLPVVDDSGKLIGRITIDDVMDVAKEEAEKDYQMASGISEDVESSDTILTLTRARLPWLLIGMFGGIPLFSWILFGFVTRNTRCAKYESLLRDATTRDELEQVAYKWEYSLMLRMLGPHQGIRLERLRAELDDKFEAMDQPLSSIDNNEFDQTQMVVEEMNDTEKQVPELVAQDYYPSIEDTAKKTDENGYEWFTAQDGTNFYRTIGSQADWTMLEN